MAFVGEFEIDIISALSSQLVDTLEQLEKGPLDLVSEPEVVESRQGVYQLFQGTRLVYVGKADNLKKRLTEHRTKIAGRRNITTQEMSFRCLYIHKNWTTLAPETALIKHYQGEGLSEWNGNGFGPHDPGRNREQTDKAPDGFDVQYPIRDDWRMDSIEAGEWNARELLIEMKRELPYLLRFQAVNRNAYQRGHPAYNDLRISVPRSGMPACELLALIAHSIPGAQGTIFPSHMILYLENHQYTYGTSV